MSSIPRSASWCVQPGHIIPPSFQWQHCENNQVACGCRSVSAGTQCDYCCCQSGFVYESDTGNEGECHQRTLTCALETTTTEAPNITVVREETSEDEGTPV